MYASVFSVRLIEFFEHRAQNPVFCSGWHCLSLVTGEFASLNTQILQPNAKKSMEHRENSKHTIFLNHKMKGLKS